MATELGQTFIKPACKEGRAYFYKRPPRFLIGISSFRPVGRNQTRHAGPPPSKDVNHVSSLTGLCGLYRQRQAAYVDAGRDPRPPGTHHSGALMPCIHAHHKRWLGSRVASPPSQLWLHSGCRLKPEDSFQSPAGTVTITDTTPSQIVGRVSCRRHSHWANRTMVVITQPNH
jgi:hypothetical protein